MLGHRAGSEPEIYLEGTNGGYRVGRAYGKADRSKTGARETVNKWKTIYKGALRTTRVARSTGRRGWGLSHARRTTGVSRGALGSLARQADHSHARRTTGVARGADHWGLSLGHGCRRRGCDGDGKGERPR